MEDLRYPYAEGNDANTDEAPAQELGHLGPPAKWDDPHQLTAEGFAKTTVYRLNERMRNVELPEQQDGVQPRGQHRSQMRTPAQAT